MNFTKLLPLIIFAGFIATLFIVFYINIQIHTIAVTRYAVAIKNLPPGFDGFTILHLSDLHSKSFGEKQQQLLQLIKQHDFHIVALTGDFVSKNNPISEPALDLVKGLGGDKPIYFVPGNHDWQTNFTYQDSLLSLGVEVLINRSVKYFKGDQHLWIMGVDDPYLGRDDLEAAFATVDDSAPRILLAHAPNIYEAASRKNIDLLMVGHTHGGQIRLPLLGAVVAPGQGLFPQYDYGLYATGVTSMVINGGLGESILPIRFNNKPEIVLITLTPAV